MKDIKIRVLAIIATSVTFSCGVQSNTSVDSGVKAIETAANKIEGVGFQGKPCSLEIDRTSDGKVSALRFKEEFKVDYKLPSPGSGLFGVYYWGATFDSDTNIASRSVEVKRSILGDADIVEGDGKPLFWGVPEHHHKFVIKPSLDAPKSLTYHSVERILGAVPFVVTDGVCTF